MSAIVISVCVDLSTAASSSVAGVGSVKIIEVRCVSVIITNSLTTPTEQRVFLAHCESNWHFDKYKQNRQKVV